MYMYKSMYRVAMLYWSGRFTDNSDQSLNGYNLTNLIEVYGYDAFGVTAFFDFHF